MNRIAIVDDSLINLTLPGALVSTLVDGAPFQFEDAHKGSESTVLESTSSIDISHHEMFDGRGYAFGLVGEAIPLFGRIVAIADVFDALTVARPSQKSWPIERTV